MTTKFLLIPISILVSFSCFGQSLSLDSSLEYSYDRNTKHNYKESISSAEKALVYAETTNDLKGILRASFYREISFQIESGKQYNIQKTDSLRRELLANGLLKDVARAHLHLAKTYYYFGNVQKEIAEYLDALEIYQRLNDQPGIAMVYSNMSLMYYDQHDYEPAFKNIRKAIKIDEKNKDPPSLHRDYNNLAIIYEHTGPIDSAIYFHKIAVDLAYQANEPFSLGLSLSNLGNNYIMAGELDLAEDTLLKALKVRTSIGNIRGLAFTNIRLSYLFIEKGNLKKAKAYAVKSLKYANQLSDLKIKRMAYAKFLEIAELEKRPADALYYLKLVKQLEDSLRNSSNTKEITKMVLLYDFEQQEFADSVESYAKEIELKADYDTQILEEKYIRNISIALGTVLLFLAIGLYSRFRFVKKSKAELQVEKNRSDELLLNILPSEVAEELKEKGSADARDFELVSILFSDFKGFTKASSNLSAQDLVTEINICFKAFDAIMEKYAIEKIKTIGDSYMAAGGIPKPKKNSVQNTVLASLEMQRFISEHKIENDKLGKPAFEMRVGIHTGPVVAGIVGVKKFQYDIWGDTVNTASRMESSGEVGKVNISQATYELLKSDDNFAFESRGKIEAKGKGEMEMWFVELKGNEK